jgi:hypothetical protein
MDREFFINDAFIMSKFEKIGDYFKVLISYSKDDYLATYRCCFEYDDGIKFLNDTIDRKFDNDSFVKFILNYDNIDDYRFNKYIPFHKDMGKIFSVLISEIPKRKRPSSRRVKKS